MGRHWHAAATRAGLPRRVEDLQACLHYLHKHLARASGKASVVLHATSAGGVPAGALLNTCPEVCLSSLPGRQLLSLTSADSLRTWSTLCPSIWHVIHSQHSMVADRGLISQAPTMGCLQAVTGAVLHAPLLDLSGVMDDPDALLTQHEYAEWGDPSIPVEHAVLQRTCPLTNLRPARCAWPGVRLLQDIPL